MIFLGVDPGINGAFALIGQASEVLATGTYEYFLSMAKTIKEPIVAAIEHQQFQWRDMGPAAFNIQHLLVNYGEWRGAMAALGIKYETIPANTWQAAMGIHFPKGTTGLAKGKLRQIKQEIVLSLARTLFPEAPLKHKNDDGIAAALLIAEYRRQKGKQQDVFGRQGHNRDRR